MTAAELELTISTPGAVLVESAEALSLRAEDASGGFGVLPGHADLLTVLPASVVRWRERDGSLRFCALRGGVMTVMGGRRVAIACRRGVVGQDLAALEAEAQAMRAQDVETQRGARVDETRLHARAVRQLMRYLRPAVRGGGGFPNPQGPAP